MHSMSVADVMTTDVVRIAPDVGYRQIADLLVSHRIRAVPVVNADGVVLGVVSQADLLDRLQHADDRPHHPLVARARSASRPTGGGTAADLMSAPAVTVRADVPVSTAARLMVAAGVKQLPVLDADRTLVGIVSRHDVLRVLARSDHELHAEVERTLLTLDLPIRKLRVDVHGGLVRLGGITDEDSARTAFTVVASVLGVVDVLDGTTRPR